MFIWLSAFAWKQQYYIYVLVNIIRGIDIAWLMQWCPKDSHQGWHEIELPKTSQNVDLRFPLQYCWGIKTFWMRYCDHMHLLVFRMNSEKHWPNEKASDAQHQIMFYIFSIYWVFQPLWLSVAIQPFAWRNWKTLHIMPLKKICLRAEKQALDLWTLKSTDHITTMLGFTLTDITAKPVYPAKSIHNRPCHLRMQHFLNPSYKILSIYSTAWLGFYTSQYMSFLYVKKFVFKNFRS